MTDRAPPGLPALPPQPAVGLAVLVNLEPRLAATPCAQVFAEVLWDGPPLDPDVVGARAMLALLR